MIKLDYTLQTPEERQQLVEKILEENPNVNETYLETLADYLIIAIEKKEKKEGKRKALTENRQATITKREISFEGLAAQFENGEDGIYNLITDNKHTIFRPKMTITKKDIEVIPTMAAVQDAIKYWEMKSKTTTGRDRYIAKKALIEARKDQYFLKNSYYQPITPKKLTRVRAVKMLPSKEWIEHGETFADLRVCYEGASLLNPKAISATLCDYSRLKEAGEGNFFDEIWYYMESFDRICGIALKDYPMYERIVETKIDGLTNEQIQQILQEEFGVNHSPEYISSLWRNKIPKIIASAAEDAFLDNYFLNEEKGQYKKCSRCGEIKLALPKYFSKNKTSRDGFYSICKACRNKQRG